MTPEQQAAYVIAQAACANAEIAGMQAENLACVQAGGGIRWTRASFMNVTDAYCISHNAVIGMFQSR